jgi:type IV pilus assembly protein PilC
MTAEEGLEGAFQQIAEMSEKRASIAQQWRKAMIYPCIVLTITIAALGFMLWKVVPEFQSVYSQFKSPLPFLTKVTIDVSKGLFSHSYVLVLLIVVFVALIWWARSNTTSRLQWDRIECKLPLLGKVFEGSALGRAMATLSGLLAVGVPTQEALKFAVPACGNKWIEKVLGDVADALGTKDIQEAVRDNAKNLPDTLVGFIETGAATADLDTVLKRYARFAQRDADVAVQSLSTFIEPIMLIIVGGIVGVIVISMYLPMINLVKVIH